MASQIQPDQIDFTMHPSGGGSEVSVAQLTQSLAALQEMIYLAAMQTEGRSLREPLRLPEELKSRYVLQCAPPELGSFLIRGRVVSRSGPAELFPPSQTVKVASLVLAFSLAASTGAVEKAHALMPDSRLRERMFSCVAKLSPPVGSGHRYELGGADCAAVFTDTGLPQSVSDQLRPPEAHQEVQTVTGRLHEIDFARHKLTMFHAPTQRALVCSYGEDIELMLLENRRDLIQVTGQVIMDDKQQPREIVDVDQIWELDLSPFVMADIDGRAVLLHARRVVELVPTLTADEQLLCLLHPSWGLDVFAPTRAELLVELKGQLQMLWTEYALAHDADLSDPALRVKQQLLADWEEVSRAQG